MHSKNSSQQKNRINLGYSNFKKRYTFSRDQTDFQESQSSDSDEESARLVRLGHF